MSDIRAAFKKMAVDFDAEISALKSSGERGWFIFQKAWQAALSANGGEAVPFAHCYTDVNGKAKELCHPPECASEGDKRVITALYTHPAPPSVAVPEGFCLERGHRRHYARTGEVCSCPKYVRHPHCDRAEMDDTLPIANPWRTAAPQPDHIADAGKVVAWRCYERETGRPAIATNPEEKASYEKAGRRCVPLVELTPAADGGKVERVGMIPVDEQKPTLGVPVIGFSPDWIDPDFNDRGLRECFTFGDATNPSWHSAKWWDEQDCYTTGEDAPTHWFPMLANAHPAESREEIQTQGLEEFAEWAWGLVVDSDKFNFSGKESVGEVLKWARMEAARLRVSQQEDRGSEFAAFISRGLRDTAGDDGEGV